MANPQNRRRPSNVAPANVIPQTTSAEQLLQDLTERRRAGAPVEEHVSFWLCVLDEHGGFAILPYATIELLRASLVSYIGRDVALSVFVGASLGISEASSSQPLLRYLMIPGRQPVPLFDTPSELRRDREGYVGQPYRVLSTPLVLEDDTEVEEAPAAVAEPGAADDEPNDEDSIV
jgi:hypothetical protein